MQDQCQRLWPNNKPTFDECAEFAGKPLPVNMLCLAPHSNITVCLSTQSPSESIGEIFTDICRLSIWILYDLGTCVGYDTHIVLLA